MRLLGKKKKGNRRVIKDKYIILSLSGVMGCAYASRQSTEHTGKKAARFCPFS